MVYSKDEGRYVQDAFRDDPSKPDVGPGTAVVLVGQKGEGGAGSGGPPLRYGRVVGPFPHGSPLCVVASRDGHCRQGCPGADGCDALPHQLLTHA